MGPTHRGDDRYLGTYFCTEILDRLSDDDVTFLTRMSVVERMCGPLCDWMLERRGSHDLLRRCSDQNLFIVPLDRTGEWRRFHRLFRQLLHAELRRREPELIGILHERASIWFESHDMPEEAVEHAHAAGATAHLARLLLDAVQPVWASGRIETALRWIGWFDDRDVLPMFPEVAVHGALLYAVIGRPAEAERWVLAAERASPDGTGSDGSTIEALLAYLRALLCRAGIAEMRRDSQIGFDGMSFASPYRATMLNTEGLSHLLEGDDEQGDAVLVAAWRSQGSGSDAARGHDPGRARDREAGPRRRRGR